MLILFGYLGSAQAATKTLADKSFGQTKGFTPAFAAGDPIPRTKKCETTPKADPIPVFPSHLHRLRSGLTDNIHIHVVVPTEACSIVGSRHDFVDWMTGAKLGEFNVTEIRSIGVGGPLPGLNPSFQTPLLMLTFYHGLSKPPQDVAFLLGKAEFKSPLPFYSHTWAQPKVKGLLTTYEVPKIVAMTKQKGLTILDVRSKAEFEAGHFAKAINMPFGNPAPERDAKRDLFKSVLVPPFSFSAPAGVNKGTTIAIYANDPTDPRGYEAAFRMSHDGWINVGVIWGGYRALRGELIEPPETYPGIQNIELVEVLAEQNKGAVIVDVRDTARFKEHRIAKAKQVEYNVTRWIKKQVQTPKDLSEDKFATSQLPPKDKLVIFYGSDQLDWRPLLAAVAAKNKGWKNVRWFRKGVAFWRSANDLARHIYEVESN